MYAGLHAVPSTECLGQPVPRGEPATPCAKSSSDCLGLTTIVFRCLEATLSSAAVARGFASYLATLCGLAPADVRMQVGPSPLRCLSCCFRAAGLLVLCLLGAGSQWQHWHALFFFLQVGPLQIDLTALLLIVVLTAVLAKGTKESSQFNMGEPCAAGSRLARGTC